MSILSIDIETYSDVDLGKCGVYKYCDSQQFEILLFAYAFDDEKINVIDLASSENIPSRVMKALTDENIIKTAFNANFERTCISKHFNIECAPKQWECTHVKASTLGLPPSLEKVGKALNFEEDKQKMKEGKSLIRYFCIPCKPTKINGGRTRNLPKHDKEKWGMFKKYCIQDVAVEREIRNKLNRYSTTKREKELWNLDQKINDRGVAVDMLLASNAITINNNYVDLINSQAKKITGLDNPNSVMQLKEWCLERGCKIDKMTKNNIKELKKTIKDKEILRILDIRSKMSKTSVKKYTAMKNSICIDGRVRGLLQFYGANRTGRWAGRLVQVQNLPRNKLKDLELARAIVRDGNLELLELLFGDVSDTLSQLIRTAFIPRHGCRFIVSDFSAIEARVIAYLANEKWRIDVFKTHGKIYEASASQMFKVPIESIKKGDPLRQKGKISELALGYGGGVGALTAMGALEQGLTEDELKPLVDSWRTANPNITKFWWDCDRAAKGAIKERTTVKLNKLKFMYNPGVLFVELPSGRRLAYVRPRIEKHEVYGGDKITYEGVNQTSKKWERIDTYGPKLVENIVQAFARDCLAEAMLNLDEAGYSVIMHVHDEVIIEAEKNKGSLKDVIKIMCREIPWAKGLPLNAEGFECNYYMKD